MKTLGPTPLVHETAELIDVQLGAYTEIGPHVQISESTLGDYSYVVDGSQIIYAEIGKFCSIAAYTRINPGNHPLDRAALHHFTYRSRQFGLGKEDTDFFNWRRSYPVKLGHDVWIGHGAIVLPGVTVGTGAAIGAGAVVTKDVEPFTVMAGVPARPLRERFPRVVREGLLEIRWWDWNHEQLSDAIPDFRNLSASEFVEKYR